MRHLRDDCGGCRVCHPLIPQGSQDWSRRFDEHERKLWFPAIAHLYAKGQLQKDKADMDKTREDVRSNAMKARELDNYNRLSLYAQEGQDYIEAKMLERHEKISQSQRHLNKKMVLSKESRAAIIEYRRTSPDLTSDKSYIGFTDSTIACLDARCRLVGY